MEWRYLCDVCAFLKAREAEISEPSKALEKRAVVQAQLPCLQNGLKERVTRPFSATGMLQPTLLMGICIWSRGEPVTLFQSKGCGFKGEIMHFRNPLGFALKDAL